MPRCDRVEVFSLSGEAGSDAATGFPVRPYAAYSRILDRKTLTGPDAEALAALWRSQTFGHEYPAMCHKPAFGVRFYRGSSLTFETSVCFRCSNFYVPVLGTAAWWGMDSKAPSATQLLLRLQEIVPASVPKPDDTPPPHGAAENDLSAPARRDSSVAGVRGENP